MRWRFSLSASQVAMRQRCCRAASARSSSSSSAGSARGVARSAWNSSSVMPARGRRAQQADVDVGSASAVSMPGRARVAHLGLLLAEEVGERLQRAPAPTGRPPQSGSVSMTATLKSRSVFFCERGRVERPAARRRSRRRRPSRPGRSRDPRRSAPAGRITQMSACATRPGSAWPRGEHDRRRSACGRTRRSSARGCGSRRRCRCPPRSPVRPAASAAAEPPDEPPGVRDEVPRIVGRAVDRRCSSASRPASAARWSCRRASRRHRAARSTASAFARPTLSLSAGSPQVVG